MAYIPAVRLRLIILISSILLTSCTKNVDSLPLNEQALNLSSRFDSDLDADDYRNPLEILDFSELTPGMKIVDILGGGGYYSELFNHIVGESGQVYLQNNSLFLRFSKDELIQRLRHNRLANVTRLDSEYSDMKLPVKADIIFLGLSYHDFFVQKSDPIITAVPEDFYRQIKASLKPNGIIILIDHAAAPDTGISMTSKLHRIDENWVQSDMHDNGFELIETLNTLRNHNDTYDLKIWDPQVRHKTDRFIHKYKLIGK